MHCVIFVSQMRICYSVRRVEKERYLRRLGNEPTMVPQWSKGGRGAQPALKQAAFPRGVARFCDSL